MKLRDDIELANTKEKLAELEKRYAALRADKDENPRVRELTMLSFKKLINQLKEEIAWYEASRRQGIES